MKNNLSVLKLSLESLVIYHKLGQDELLQKFKMLLQSIKAEQTVTGEFISSYCAFQAALYEKNGVNSFADYLLEQIIFSDNYFSRYSESRTFAEMDQNLLQALKRELNIFQEISKLTGRALKDLVLPQVQDAEERALLASLPEWTGTDYAGEDGLKGLKKLFQETQLWSDCSQALIDYHYHNGSGQYAIYRAFVWQKRDGKGYLEGIKEPDKITLAELIGYELEREEVIANTEHFINGFRANNVLLYGDKGTGKSSTVKAILNEYAHKGLKMIEVSKLYLTDFPEIIRLVRGRKQKFILFVDDLAFEDNEDSYTALKAILEGGLESKPDNVIIYATSNRRHLIKEKLKDRAGLGSNDPDEEMRSRDTLQEKLSLADRFGITVTFMSPDQKKYLQIIEELAKIRNIQIEQEFLHKEALKWSLWYNGRSPRTAQQFIDWLEGHVSLNGEKN